MAVHRAQNSCNCFGCDLFVGIREMVFAKTTPKPQVQISHNVLICFVCGVFCVLLSGMRVMLKAVGRSITPLAYVTLFLIILLSVYALIGNLVLSGRFDLQCVNQDSGAICVWFPVVVNRVSLKGWLLVAFFHAITFSVFHVFRHIGQHHLSLSVVLKRSGTGFSMRSWPTVCQRRIHS
jgi:hypothetical protein